MSLHQRFSRLSRAQDGFTMIVAMGVLLVTSLLCAAVFTTVQGDARTTGADLDGKRAYAAAQAGLQAYLYQLNANATTEWWESCANDKTPTGGVSVPGAGAGVVYSYAPVVPCGAGTPAASSPDLMIDSAGNLRMEFTGSVTGGSGTITKTIVAGFKTNSPLSYLWYTVHETLDPAANSQCAASSQYFYWNAPIPPPSSSSTIPAACQINWTTGDVINGPLYTQDQLLIQSGSSPSFQSVVSADSSTDPNQVCVGGCLSTSSPDNSHATFTSRETVGGGAPAVPFPTSNANLANDASAHGLTYTGTVNVYLNGTTATIINCSTTSTSNCTTTTNVSLATDPIIYASNGSCNSSYTPNDVTYSLATVSGKTAAYGPCGDIYVSGTYSLPLTLASANSIVVMGNVLNGTDTNGSTTPTGVATLGLIASQYVRVYHPATISNGTCSTYSASNPNVTIDAAILTLQHSFFVDNYGCGSSTMGTLTVHGAIAQYYRGAVGQSFTNGNTTTPTGYYKNYNYDARLADILPPYLIDLQNSTWTAVRESLCSTTAGTC